ncbi:uncharacterized protein LACBIDRAFT_335747 [Laccaria bicolor S238N-H82]|uniref:Predicted protein n=1 Tax=Laccaria bicolor (strain S238N-H82 / ATCC MYA-4686) TaxID=486041 RepID=B0E3A2_LACBS|nr:uncharacterized protein LACBIDRAFT_335747 [Laccaria bicolor S238N-H82]EDQ98679.1 predicted protein [Laccaria bicolor S238N-H82]|eukprot:XP_001890669.1 predicted protein [Laccaria bicolor S238N-H82]
MYSIQLKGLSDKKPMGFGWGGVWGMGYGRFMGYAMHFSANQLVGCKMLWDKRGYGFSEGIREVMGSQRYKDTGICVYELVQNSQKRATFVDVCVGISMSIMHCLLWRWISMESLGLFWHSFGQAKDIPVL